MPTKAKKMHEIKADIEAIFITLALSFSTLNIRSICIYKGIANPPDKKTPKLKNIAPGEYSPPNQLIIQLKSNPVNNKKARKIPEK
jgi:hypothetical protein